jgi:hypothetical protein
LFSFCFSIGSVVVMYFIVFFSVFLWGFPMGHVESVI